MRNEYLYELLMDCSQMVWPNLMNTMKKAGWTE